MVRGIGIIVICLILFTPSILEANPSCDVPLDHWSYGAVEKLAILNLADIAFLDTKPVSRIKMAYTIKSAIEKAEKYQLEFEWEEQNYLETLLYELIEEFREELVTIGVDVAAVSDEGPKGFIFHAPELNVDKVVANLDSENTLFENNDGWSLSDGFNARVKLNSWAKVDNLFAISLTPGLRYSKDDTDIDFEDGHVRFSHPSYNLELAFGRASMWWGPGFHGSLLMSNNIFPMETVRFNNIYPFRLPWVLSKMGRFNGLFFVSRLEKDRVIPYPWLCGWRLDYVPRDFLKLGFGHILMFGGEGVEKVDFTNFWSAASLVFSAAGGGTETENHIISGDAELFIRRIDRWLPLATGAKLYTEWGAEDEAGNVPIEFASVSGVYFTDVFKIPGFDGKIEFAKLNRIWYTHFKYGSGYTYRGNIIGHHAGGDAEDIAVTGIFNFPLDYKISTTLSYQRHGLNEPNVETTNELRFAFSMNDALKMYRIHNIEMDVFYEFEHINNYKNTTDKVKNHLLGVEVRRRF